MSTNNILSSELTELADRIISDLELLIAVASEEDVEDFRLPGGASFDLGSNYVSVIL